MKIRLSTLLTLALLGAGVVGAGSALQALTGPRTQASSAPDFEGPRIVGMRRLTEAQYRNTIADIFGPDIRVAGRFEPIVRPAHELIASGASDASISPAGLEQFDAIYRGIAAQVFDAAHSPQFVTCTPANGAVFDDGCAARILTPIGRYLFRRPPAQRKRRCSSTSPDAAAGRRDRSPRGSSLHWLPCWFRRGSSILSRPLALTRTNPVRGSSTAIRAPLG